MQTRAAFYFRPILTVGLFLAAAHSAQAADAADSLVHMAPLESTSEGSKIKVKIATVPNGCAWGDADAIESELKAGKKPNLIVSLESLLPSDASFKPMTHDIANFDLQKGYVASFNLPKASRPLHLGIYICRDTENAGRCGNKTLVPVQTVLDQYTVPVDQKTGKPLRAAKAEAEPKDKAYYFGYLLVTKNGIGVTKSKLQEADYTKLEKFLVELGSQPGIAKAVKAKSDPIDSVQPMLTEKGIVSVFLPKLEKSQCPK